MIFADDALGLSHVRIFEHVEYLVLGKVGDSLEARIALAFGVYHNRIAELVHQVVDKTLEGGPIELIILLGSKEAIQPLVQRDEHELPQRIVLHLLDCTEKSSRVEPLHDRLDIVGLSNTSDIEPRVPRMQSLIASKATVVVPRFASGIPNPSFLR